MVHAEIRKMVNTLKNGANRERRLSRNWPGTQSPLCPSTISHNAPFCSRNVHICAYFCYHMMHCGIIVQCWPRPPTQICATGELCISCGAYKPTVCSSSLCYMDISVTIVILLRLHLCPIYHVIICCCALCWNHIAIYTTNHTGPHIP